MNSRTTAVVGMIVLAALTRLVPHYPNFTAVSAMALFGAAYLPSRKLALAVPLAVMFLSDVWLEVLPRLGWVAGWMAHGRGFYDGMWVNYGATILVVILGFTLRNHKSVPVVAGVTLLGSVIFFVVTNFGVWVYETMYPHTAAGLWDCYYEALPFFRNQLLGDAVYVGLLFGGFALAERRIPALAQSGQ